MKSSPFMNLRHEFYISAIRWLCIGLAVGLRAGGVMPVLTYVCIAAALGTLVARRIGIRLNNRHFASA